MPATLVLVGVATAGILTAPRAGLELADGTPDTLQPAEAAVATAAPEPSLTTATVAVAPPTVPAATAPVTTATGRVVATETDIAASDLESFFVALESGDLVGAFDHLEAAHQTAVGGFEPFQALWRAPARIVHEPADCAVDDGGFACRITFRTYTADGRCSAAVYSFRLRPTGTRNSIVAERPIAQRSCPALETTTTAASG